MGYTLTDCPPEEITQGAIRHSKDAIEHMQRAAGLEGDDVDGMFGKQTRDALHKKFGDLTNEKVIAGLDPQMQEALKIFNRDVQGSKGYFYQPEECAVDGTVDIVLPDIPTKEGLLHSSGPAAVEPPMARPTEKAPIVLNDKEQSDYGKDQSGWGKGEFAIIPTPAEAVEKGSLQHASPPAASDPKPLGLAQVDPISTEIITLENRLGETARPELIEPPNDLSTPQANVYTPAAQGPMDVVAKELPENLSGMTEPSGVSDLQLSTALGSAGISDPAIYDKITATEKSGWTGADGPNTAVAGGWAGKMLSSAFESATNFVQDAYASVTSNLDAAPAEIAQEQQRATAFTMRAGM